MFPRETVAEPEPKERGAALASFVIRPTRSQAVLAHLALGPVHGKHSTDSS